MPTGTIKRYEDNRGFGFIKPDDGGDDLFFHVKGFATPIEPREHDRVSFEVGCDPRNEFRIRAVNLALVQQP